MKNYGGSHFCKQFKIEIINSSVKTGIATDPLRLNLLTGGEKDVLQETEMCFDQFCSHTTHQHLWRINTAIDDLLSTIVSDNEVLTAN